MNNLNKPYHLKTHNGTIQHLLNKRSTFERYMYFAIPNADYCFIHI